MINYRITRFDASTLECRVFDDDKASYELQHIPLHSPTGYNCGYLGSGPADLALALLVHHLGEDPTTVMDIARNKIGGESKALDLHQRFKSDIVANIFLGDNESYNLPGARIGQWVYNGV
jgi:hypothetical protein